MKSLFFLILVGAIWAALIILMSPLQLPLTILAAIFKNKRLRKYRYNFWIWQDQGVNMLLGGNPDVTVSSQVGYMAHIQNNKTAKGMAKFIDAGFKLATGQIDHCRVSIEKDEDHTRWGK